MCYTISIKGDENMYNILVVDDDKEIGKKIKQKKKATYAIIRK